MNEEELAKLREKERAAYEEELEKLREEKREKLREEEREKEWAAYYDEDELDSYDEDELDSYDEEELDSYQDEIEEQLQNFYKELYEEELDSNQEELDSDEEELDKMNEDKLDSDEEIPDFDEEELDSDEEELDSDEEESTVEQTSAEESTAEQVSAEQTFFYTDESTAEELNEFIAKKYTRKQIAQLFLREEIETKAEIEEKEKNLASAYDEDANQNSKKSIKSEESTESEESQESEESTESEESQESEESTESEESQESEESTESTESEESQESEEDIPYMDKVDSYQRKTGLTDAVQTGIGQLDGIPVALAVMDFQFIGGSMGSVVGEKITRLIQYATRKSLPLIISCASGGARMQEGSFSLMQMAKISSTLFNFQFHENLFLVSLLTSPTTGGVTASFGMLGDIIIGEPDAYIAFAGKRVIEEVMKIEVPEGVQEAEYLFEMGSLDSIVPRNLLKGVLSELLTFHDIFHFSKSQNKKQGGLCSEEFGIF
uniref:acetyl-CoA carboxylase carboxyltransferase beta subunit n=1 Tax=Carex sp. SCSB-B-000526 TaxID=2919619 RepID=UPI001F132703|nr:acetyl-CoA carboxylase carboxyltransferase beta subunit [Carex sp. SCSB-B-000526]YP_010292502.1 acetyl-CoA carboxylase carboxyltransferase beta subunit [Carex sp. SCSB-B-000526]ULQ64411.1 acetyl-CoA carboxylase carboxyltransferase beta subunit [Carex sp. SCSB-B-000526]ULQ64434.1 acetyl-CoA carboxylase carboxyltransferase beta subunit [Carex sp. SCSB-B-000526]